MYYFSAILICLLIISLVYIFTNDRLRKPIGGIIINLDEDGLTARVGVALYKDYDISDLVKRKYVVLEVDQDFDLKSLNAQD